MASEADGEVQRRAIALQRAKNELSAYDSGPRQFFVQWCAVLAIVVVYYLSVHGDDWSLFGVFCAMGMLLLGYQIFVQLNAMQARIRVVMALLEELQE